MLTTVNLFYGNVFYIVTRAKLAWLHIIQPLVAFLRIQDGGLGHLDDIEGRVIPVFKGFPGWGVHFSECMYI